MGPLVDIHTHLYPPSYISLLSSRTTVPYIHHPPPSDPSSPRPPPRLIILPTDDSPSIPPSHRGRPIDHSFSSIPAKLSFMRTHSISTSILSLANPWLDFLPPSTAAATAIEINNELASLSAASPGRIYAFATLPLSAPVPDIVAEVHRLASPSHPELRASIKGIILGTSGLGSGLDDPALDQVWAALEATQTLVFLHPHYGLPASVYGARAGESGHVLPLALGFPMETTIAFTRAFLAGVFDRYPRLMVLLAHAGGTVPFLAGRVESCVEHERVFVEGDGEGRGRKPRRKVAEVLRENVWLDAVVYGGVGVRAAVEAVGGEKVLWGTDHPFFPPVGGEAKAEGKGEGEWLSVKMNVEGVREAFGENKEGAERVLGGNAVRLLGLEI